MALENIARERETEHQPERKPKLVEKYGEVGPAAINAALQCKGGKKKKEEPKRLYEPREEA